MRSPIQDNIYQQLTNPFGAIELTNPFGAMSYSRRISRFAVLFPPQIRDQLCIGGPQPRALVRASIAEEAP